MLIRVMGFVERVSIVCLFIISGTGWLCSAQTPSPDFLLVSDSLQAVEAGSTAHAVVKIVNPTTQSIDIQIELIVPEGWSTVGTDTPVQIAGGTNRIKVIPFFIPHHSPVGRSDIQIKSYTMSDGQQFGLLTVVYDVQPKYEIAIHALNSPGFIFGGDTLVGEFIVQNQSNTEVDVSIEKIFNQHIIEKDYLIPRGGQKHIRMEYLSDASLGFVARQSVSINAFIKGHSETKKSGAIVFNVLPKASGDAAIFHKIPLEIGTMMVTDNIRGKQMSFMMMDIRGGGLIHPEKGYRLDFQIRGPQKQGNPVTGVTDRYYLKFKSPATLLMVGDHNYRLSDLTESSRNGLGIGVERGNKKIRYGGFVNYPRHYPDVKLVTGVFLEFYSKKKNSLKIGALQKVYAPGDQAILTTLSGNILSLSWMDVELELAGGYRNGSASGAMRSVFQAQYKGVKGHFAMTQAQPDFPGYYNNTRFISSGLSYYASKRYSISASYDFNHSNLALDTLYVNAPYSQNGYLLGDYRMNTNNRVSFGLFARNREDRSVKKLFHYQEFSGRVAYVSTHSALRLNMYVEAGKIFNFLNAEEDRTSNSLQGNLTTILSLGKFGSLDGFVNYQYGRRYQGAEYHRLYYGLSYSLLRAGKYRASLSYRNNYELEQYYRDRSLMTVNVQASLTRRQELGVAVNYHLVKNSVDQKGFSALVRYHYKLFVKTSRLNDVGHLSGTIRQEDSTASDGIWVSLANQTTVTNTAGEFHFKNIPAGTYYLRFDESGSGIGTIPDKPGPYSVTIFPDQQVRYDLLLTKAAAITAKIVIQKDSRMDQKGYISPSRNIDALLLEVKKGEEMFRAYTDKNGIVSFTDLRPGEWEVTLYSQGLPSGYTADFQSQTISLSPGSDFHLDLPIKQKAIKIKLQKK